MNMQVAKSDLTLVLPGLSPYRAPRSSARRYGLAQRVRAAVQWLVELPRRNALIQELSLLSDHELADIGLRRSDLHRVFDPAFAAERNAERVR